MKLESVVGRGYTEKRIALLTRIKTLDEVSAMLRVEREEACREIDEEAKKRHAAAQAKAKRSIWYDKEAH